MQSNISNEEKKINHDLHLKEQYFIREKSFKPYTGRAKGNHQGPQIIQPKPHTLSSPFPFSFLIFFVFLRDPLYGTLSPRKKQSQSKDQKKHKPLLSSLLETSPFPILSFLSFVQRRHLQKTSFFPFLSSRKSNPSALVLKWLL